mmetsp:Transcript_10457/g.43291  ORF Transcript_10457/g.43291 Transcript_10457/m.43291 type:complete len:219 (-) Transcript_10457:1101-1757(-)
MAQLRQRRAEPGMVGPHRERAYRFPRRARRDAQWGARVAIAEGGGGRGELIEGGFAQVARHTEGTGFDRVCFEHVACVAELRHPILNVRNVFLRLNQGLVLFRGAGGRSAPVHGLDLLLSPKVTDSEIRSSVGGVVAHDCNTYRLTRDVRISQPASFPRSERDAHCGRNWGKESEKLDRTFGCANEATRLDTLSGPTHVRRSFNPWPGYGSNRGAPRR